MHIACTRYNVSLEKEVIYIVRHVVRVFMGEVACELGLLDKIIEK